MFVIIIVLFFFMDFIVELNFLKIRMRFIIIYFLYFRTVYRAVIIESIMIIISLLLYIFYFRSKNYLFFLVIKFS